MTNNQSFSYPKPVLGVVAYSGTGKTTLLKKVIPLLNAMDIRVALIKHAHHEFDIDKPGKDSYELRQAGATPVLIASDKRIALMVERQSENTPTPTELLEYLNADDIDLVLIEGFKHLEYPKIILHRSDSGKPADLLIDVTALAVVTDLNAEKIRETYHCHQPVLNINDAHAVALFIKQFIDSETNQ